MDKIQGLDEEGCEAEKEVKVKVLSMKLLMIFHEGRVTAINDSLLLL